MIGRNIAEESEHVSIFSHEKNKEQDKNWLEKDFQFGIIMFFFLNDCHIDNFFLVLENRYETWFW